MSNLFQPYNLAGTTLANRVVMAPMTRARALDDIPDEHTVLYYAQRASAGLIISEGAPISREGCGYLFNPGLYNDAQVQGWRRVTDAVHAKGGKIFAQLWHVGRVSHVSMQPEGAAPVAPSAIQPQQVKAFIETAPGVGELVQPPVPRALSTQEVKDLVGLYAQAARNAIAAGFDGVEIHSANGYLVNQFISAHSNQREDEYGGSLHNRLGFLREIVEAVSEAIGAQRLGVRFSPLFSGTDQDRVYIGLVEEDPHHTYIEAVKVLEAAGIAYLSIAEADWDNAPELPETFRRAVRESFSGRIIYAGRYTAERGEKLVQSGLADLIAFGRPFIANPDLPQRLFNGWPLNPLRVEGMYGGSEQGYTDYPTYAAAS